MICKTKGTDNNNKLAVICDQENITLGDLYKLIQKNKPANQPLDKAISVFLKAYFQPGDKETKPSAG